ncbi:hypothetical protein F5B19DRAFT_355196 [Rostrohypoxylon terebratum]|nr:hypothetical protein F5B19DRAFT_355196 [Rostrohypoxylon terebratum]
MSGVEETQKQSSEGPDDSDLTPIPSMSFDSHELDQTIPGSSTDIHPDVVADPGSSSTNFHQWPGKDADARDDLINDLQTQIRDCHREIRQLTVTRQNMQRDYADRVATIQDDSKQTIEDLTDLIQSYSKKPCDLESELVEAQRKPKNGWTSCEVALLLLLGAIICTYLAGL